MEKGISDHEIFRTLLKEIPYSLPSDSRVGLSKQLRTFQVEKGMTYDSFYLQLLSYWMKSLRSRIPPPELKHLML